MLEFFFFFFLPFFLTPDFAIFFFQTTASCCHCCNNATHTEIVALSSSAATPSMLLFILPTLPIRPFFYQLKLNARTWLSQKHLVPRLLGRPCGCVPRGASWHVRHCCVVRQKSFAGPLGRSVVALEDCRR